MSHYYTRWCKDHGDYDEDVDNPGECPTCEKLGITPSQLAAKHLARLTERVRELEAVLRVFVEIHDCSTFAPASPTHDKIWLDGVKLARTALAKREG